MLSHHFEGLVPKETHYGQFFVLAIAVADARLVTGIYTTGPYWSDALQFTIV